MTIKERAIIMAYTGVCMLTGDKYKYFQEYVNELMGRPVYTHELADEAVCDEIKEKAKPDFLKLCAEPKCMDLPMVSIRGAKTEGAEGVSELIYEAVSEMEYKFEIGAIIALLRKLLTATWDFNIAYRKHIGVLVEDVLNFLIDAMEAELEKEEKENENDNA